MKGSTTPLQLKPFMNKPLIGLIGSAVLTIIGTLLRLNAHAIAWSNSGYSYSGPASQTTWGLQEAAIGQISMALAFAGILIGVGTYFYWLLGKKSEK
jgi:hypothetical protein